MAHEDLTREQHFERSSDRSFGLVFAGVFLVIAGLPLFHGEMPRWWASGVAVVFALVAVVKPALLARFNQLWIRFGALISKVISPIVLGLLFYAVLTPVGAVMRLAGKDPLRLKRYPDMKSYWMPRVPPGPPPDSMTNQF